MIFLAKIVFGCLNLAFHQHEYIANDVSFFQVQAIHDLSVLNTQPRRFFNEWLLNWGDLKHHLNFLKKGNSVYWSDLGTLFHSKFMVLANIFTIGNFYANVVFYNVLFFLGQLCLYKVFYKLQPEKKYLFLVTIFLIPSVLFWCSALYKDGWVLSAIGFFSYALMQFQSSGKMKFLLLVLMSACFLLVIRYFYFFCMLPALISMLMASKRKHSVFYFIGVYCIAIIIFFTGKNIFNGFDPMKYVASKQYEFLGAIGYSDMKTPLLQDTISSYIHNFPIALHHIFLQPTLSLNPPLKYQIAALDSFLVLLLICLMLFFIKRKNASQTFYWFAVFFSLSVYLFIGYTIPNCGALVRYKSEFTALLLPSLVGLSEVPFFKKWYVKQT